MLRNKKFLIGFFTCAGLVLIMAHDYNSNHSHYDYASNYHSHSDTHSHYEYADSYHSHNDILSGNYADASHDHNYGYNAYAPKDHTHGTGYNSYADRDHKHADLELLMREAGYNLTELDKLDKLIKQFSGLDQKYNNIQTINTLNQKIEDLEYELLNHEH